MKSVIAAALVAGLTITAPVLAQEAFTGVWEISTGAQQDEAEITVWTVTEVDGEYVIEAEGAGASPEVLETLGVPTSVEIEFDGTSFSVSTTFPGSELVPGPIVIVNSGVIDGDTFEGAMTFGEDSAEIPTTGTRR